MNIQEKISLKEFTTFKIGGDAKYFTVVENNSELKDAVLWAKENEEEIFILGGGSNILISDNGFEGLVIKNEINNLDIDKNTIKCGSGVLLSDIVKSTSDNSWTGMEWAAGVPGTIGGAVRGNAGAFHRFVMDNIVDVEAFDKEKEMFRKFKKEGCEFKTKTSIFKKDNNLIISQVKLSFEEGNKKDIDFKIKDGLDYRSERHPEDPSAGCIFINKDKKCPSSQIIEEAGLKGKKVGGAMVSNKHSNFIINSGNAKASDVIKLIDIVKKEVKDKLKKNLTEEIQKVGKYDSK